MKKLILLCLFLIANWCNAAPGLDSLYRQSTRCFKLGDYAGSLKLNLQALEKARLSGDCSEQVYAMHQVARMHYYLRDKRAALGLLLETRRQADACGVDSTMNKVLHNIGSIYQELNVPDSSFAFYEEARVRLDKGDNWAELSTLYGVRGELLYRFLSRDADGWASLQKCREYALRSGDSVRIAFSHMKFAIYHHLHRDIQKAEEQYRIATLIYRRAGYVEGEMYGLRNLGRTRSLLGDTATYVPYERLFVLRDSIFHARTADQFAHYNTLFRMAEKETENKMLGEKNRLQSVILLVVIVGAVLLITLIWLGYSRYKAQQEREAEKQLSIHKTLRYKAVVEAEEKERTRIARELHDGIGQILSAAKMNVSAVSPAEERDKKILDTSMNLLDRAVREVRTISHNLMPASLMELGLQAALHEMASSVNSARSFRLELDIEEELTLPPATEVTLYRVIQEVINNAMKHSQATSVSLSLRMQARMCIAEIRDNGKGFDTSNIAFSTGIGWKNIYSRVELLNGKIEVSSSPGNGTTVQIIFSNFA